MGNLKRYDFRKFILCFVYFSYLWTPMREKILADLRERKSLLLIDRSTRKKKEKQQQQRDLVLELGELAENGPEVIDQWLPRMNYWGKLYYNLSTILHILNFILGSIIISLGNQLENNGVRLQDGNYSLLCYTPRLALHEIYHPLLVTYLGFAVSILHLIWRYSVLYLENKFILDPILFLLIDDERIEFSRDREMALKFYRQYGIMELTQSLMFHKMEDRLHNVVEFRLRPSRSPEAKVELIRIVKLSIIVSCFIFIAMPFTVTPFFVRVFLVAPEIPYAGCDVVPFNFAHLYRFTISFVFATILGFDTLAALTFPLSVGAILIVDQLHYWRHIKSLLDNQLLMILQLNAPDQSHSFYNNNNNNLSESWACVGHDDLTKVNIAQYLEMKRSETGQSKLFETIPYNRSLRAMQSISPKQLEAKGIEIQSIVGDFFQQLKQADQFISITVAFAFCIWLTCNGVFTVLGLQMDTRGASNYFVRILQLIGLMILLGLTSLILTLKRSTEPAYGTICSIMANDRSVEKHRWILLLKYYTGKQRHAFTILHSKIYSLGTYLEIFSYTFTFDLFLQSFNRKMSNSIPPNI